MHPVLECLRGGDLRSIGASAAVVQRVLADPGLAGVLVAGMSADEPVVRLRCADAYEKVTALRPDLAQRDAAGLVEVLARVQAKEVLWHLLQVVPRVRWTSVQLATVLRCVEAAHEHTSGIVRANALQAAVELLPQACACGGEVGRRLRDALLSTTPAVAARARRLAARFPDLAGGAGEGRADPL